MSFLPVNMADFLPLLPTKPLGDMSSGLVPKEWVRATRHSRAGFRDKRSPRSIMFICDAPTRAEISTHASLEVWHVSTPLTSHTSFASCLNTNRRRCGVTRLHNQHDICTRQEVLLTGSLFFTRVNNRTTCSDAQNNTSRCARTVFLPKV